MWEGETQPTSWLAVLDGLTALLNLLDVAGSGGRTVITGSCDESRYFPCSGDIRTYGQENVLQDSDESILKTHSAE